MADFKRTIQPAVLDRVAGYTQNQALKASEALESNSIFNGAQVDGQKFTSGSATSVNHKLGRIVRGFIIVNQTGTLPGVLSLATSQPPDETKSISLSSTGHFTASIWFY